MAKEPCDEWAETYEILRPNHRPHAGYFSWETDRSGAAAEAGVLEVFERACRTDGQEFFTKVHHRGPGCDPPDCEATSLTGERIGIEITELVDSDSAEKARRGEWCETKDWNHDLIPTLERIIRKKDAPSILKGGPYSEYILLVHSDEGLDLVYAENILAVHLFPQTQLIARAYLLVSHNIWEKASDLWDKKFRCIRLNIHGK